MFEVGEEVVWWDDIVIGVLDGFDVECGVFGLVDFGILYVVVFVFE